MQINDDELRAENVRNDLVVDLVRVLFVVDTPLGRSRKSVPVTWSSRLSHSAFLWLRFGAAICRFIKLRTKRRLAHPGLDLKVL